MAVYSFHNFVSMALADKSVPLRNLLFQNRCESQPSSLPYSGVRPSQTQSLIFSCFKGASRWQPPHGRKWCEMPMRRVRFYLVSCPEFTGLRNPTWNVTSLPRLHRVIKMAAISRPEVLSKDYVACAILSGFLSRVY